MLVLVELSGLDAHNDRRGYAAGDQLLRGFARQLIDAVAPLNGLAYRVAASRLAVLVPAGEQQLGEVVLAATSSLRIEGTDAVVGRAFGEVAIPSEAGSAEAAFQLAGGRLAVQRQGQLRSARRQAHAVLMAALTARHPELRDELRLTAYRAISLARRLGMNAEEIDDVALAAELQSIGLLAVPEAVLESEADFDAAAIAPLRNRTLEGERIVAAASGLAPVAALVRSSAERYDGTGEPDGLAGEAIPLGSRIIATAIAFTAMTSPRPSRQALGDDDALAELRHCSGTQFDPRIVEALGAELAEEAGPPAASAPSGAPA